MNLRKLAVALMILVILAGNIQVIKGESGESSISSADKLVPPLNVTFKARINHTSDADLHAPEYNDLNTFTIFGDKICFDGDDARSLYIMDLNTGKTVWSYKAETKINTLEGLHVYQNLLLAQLDYTTEPPVGAHTWPSGSGAVIAIDMATKETTWKFPTKSNGIWSVQARDGIVYFTANDEGIYALNASTGKVKWLYPQPANSGLSGLLQAQDTIYTSTSYGLLALDPSTGREKERFNFGDASLTAGLSDLAFVNNILYGDVLEYNNSNSKVQNASFIAFDPSTNQVLWKTLLCTNTSGIFSRPIITNDSIFLTGIGDSDMLNRIYALNISSGKIIWRSERSDFYSNMILDEPYLYALDIEYLHDQYNRMFSRLNAYDVRTGKAVWNYSINKDRVSSFSHTGLYLSNGTGRKTIYIAEIETYWLPKPVGPENIVWDNEYYVYGFSSSSAESVPEFSRTPIVLAIAFLAIIPLVFRKRKELTQS